MTLKLRSIWWQLGMSAYWFATSMKWFVMLLLLGLVVKELVPGGEEGTLWGRVVMIGAIWAMVGPGLFGYLSDRTRSRFGRWRPYVALGAGLTVIAIFVLANAQYYWVVIVGYLLLQVSDDIATGPYSMLIPGLVPEEQRARASGVMGVLQFSAQITAGIAALVLGDIQAVFLTLAAVNVVCAAITIATVREDPYIQPGVKISFLDGFVRPWKSHDFCWVWFTRFLNALGFYLIVTYLSLYLAASITDYSVFGLTVARVDDETTAMAAAKQAVFVVGLLISGLAACGAVAGGRLADRIGRKKVIYFSGTTMAILLPPFALFPNFTLICVLALGFGIAYGAYTASSWALVSDVLPSRDELAKDMGIWQSSIATPQILSGIAGMLVDWGNRAYGMGKGYSMVFFLAAVSYLLSTVLVRKIRAGT